MRLDEAIACLADYQANPVPHFDSDGALFTGAINSYDGERFDVRLGDGVGAAEVWETVEAYQAGIAERRRLGLHFHHRLDPWGCPDMNECPALDDEDREYLRRRRASDSG